LFSFNVSNSLDFFLTPGNLTPDTSKWQREITVYAGFKISDGFRHDRADHHYPCPLYGEWGENGKMAPIPLR
jgi:hypothetical protein